MPWFKVRKQLDYQVPLNHYRGLVGSRSKRSRRAPAGELLAWKTSCSYMDRSTIKSTFSCVLSFTQSSNKSSGNHITKNGEQNFWDANTKDTLSVFLIISDFAYEVWELQITGAQLGFAFRSLPTRKVGVELSDST